jgi:predicted esterase
MAREANFGFRCARYINEPPKEVFEPIVRSERDYGREKPVSDEAFGLFQSLYSYDNSALDVQVESTEDSAYWRQERVSFLAAYGGERVPAVWFTPHNAAPPYQVVVYLASSIAVAEPSSRNLEPLYIDMLLRTGRAVLYPIVKGTYERRVGTTGLNSARDLVIQESKDIRRSLDFLVTRADADRDRISYLGFSRGAALAPMMLAFEPRFKTAVLIAGGLPLNQPAPEVDPLNFLSRIHIPVLMVNGRNDFTRPYATAQVPMLKFLGTSAKDKHLEVFDSGHAPPVTPTAKVVLEWLDRYLGAPKLKN